MNDFQRILHTLDARNEACAIATVVATEGSTYRHAGARMLMFADGTMVGAISGGCLEQDVFERARRVMETGIPHFIVYDGSEKARHTGVSEIIAGFGMGCNGITSILIERIQGANDPFIHTVREALQSNTPVCIATVYDADDSILENAALQGIHAFVYANSDMLDNFGEHPCAEYLRTSIEHYAVSVLQRGKAQTLSVAMPESNGCSQNTTLLVFLEPLPLPHRLVVFGAGYDALPLVEYASMLGWHISVADARPAMLHPERLAKAHIRTRFFTETLPDTIQEFDITAQTAVVVMTHHLERDAEILRSVLPQRPFYCGLLGPKARLQKIRQLWHERGYEIEESLLELLHTPIGLDIGSETAEEVALSIIAEIQAVMRGRSGGFLKMRTGGIHDDVLV